MKTRVYALIADFSISVDVVMDLGPAQKSLA
jgi:hypothetical protein